MIKSMTGYGRARDIRNKRDLYAAGYKRLKGADGLQIGRGDTHYIATRLPESHNLVVGSVDIVCIGISH